MFQRKRNSPQYGKSKPALINGTPMPKCIEEDIMVAKTTENPQREELKQKFVDRLQLECSVSPDEASDKQIYQVLSALMVEKLKHKRQHFINKTNSVGGKNVYYLSMEFLMGRSLKTTLYNLELADDVRAILQDYHTIYYTGFWARLQ